MSDEEPYLFYAPSWSLYFNEYRRNSAHAKELAANVMDENECETCSSVVDSTRSVHIRKTHCRHRAKEVSQRKRHALCLQRYLVKGEEGLLAGDLCGERGKYRWDDGRVYEGQWQNGDRHGVGVQTYADGSIYHGKWLDDEKAGGTLVFDSGEMYQGQWKNGMMHGKGALVYEDGSMYDGDWSLGMKHGQGKDMSADGGMYEGQWEHDETNGAGTEFYSNGSSYEGQWKHNLKHGTGTFRFGKGGWVKVGWEWVQKGDSYKGQFWMNMLRGEGEWTWAIDQKVERLKVQDNVILGWPDRKESHV